MTGVVQNQDSYMKGRIAQRGLLRPASAPTLARAMAEWAALTGRRYGLVDAYRCEDAEILVAMGTIADTAIAVVDHLRASGRPVGCVAVTCFRPFPADELAAAVRRARAIAVVERTDEPLAADNPLTREIKAALSDAAAEGALVPRVLSVAAGLGSRDVAAGDLVAVFDRMADHGDLGGATTRVARHPPSAGPRAGTRSTCGRPARTRCAATRSAASARSPRTRSSPRSSARSSASTCRRTRATAPRRRACRRRTT